MATTSIPHPHRIPILRRLAGDGDAYARYALAQALLRGDGVPVDRPEGERLLRLAARTLVAAQVAMANLEVDRLEGVTPAQRRRSFAWFARAAESGHPEALRGLAWRWLPHRGDATRKRRARVTLERAMRAGSASAAADLALRVETFAGDRRRVRRLLEFAVVVGMHDEDHEFALELLRRAEPYLRRLRTRRPNEWVVRSEAGDVDANVVMGYAHRFWAGVPYDPAAAHRAWEIAAVAGSTEAQIALALSAFDSEMDVPLEDAAMASARAAESGDLVAGWLTGALWTHWSPDGGAAAKFWLRRAAEHGQVNAAYLLACIERHGEGRRRSPRRAFRFARIAAEGGHDGTVSMLADMYEEGHGVRRDQREGTRWWRLAAERGNYDNRTNLGVRLHEGRGTRRDDREAVRWYRRAAAHGCPAATANLGCCYRDGHGVPKSPKLALRWLRRAAEVFENANAADLVSRLYEEGALGRPDLAEGVRWKRRGAAMGNVSALLALAVTVHKDEHATKDVAFARQLFRAAAEMGDGWSAYELGNCFRDGHGLSRDLRQARRWWRVAAKRGVRKARKALDESLASRRRAT